MRKSSKRRRGLGLPKDSDPLHILHLDSIEATRMRRPRFDGYVVGHGPHGDARYSRRRFKEDTKRLIDDEVTR